MCKYLLEWFYLEELQRLLCLIHYSPTRQDYARIQISEGGGGCWQKKPEKSSRIGILSEIRDEAQQEQKQHF